MGQHRRERGHGHLQPDAGGPGRSETGWSFQRGFGSLRLDCFGFPMSGKTLNAQIMMISKNKVHQPDFWTPE